MISIMISAKVVVVVIIYLVIGVVAAIFKCMSKDTSNVTNEAQTMVRKTTKALEDKKQPKH